VLFIGPLGRGCAKQAAVRVGNSRFFAALVMRHIASGAELWF